MIEILFDGGPNHGKQRTVRELPQAIHVPYMKPVPVMIPTPAPRPRWWRHPIRWRRWSPPAFPEPELTFQRLTYRDSGETLDGRRVYRIGTDWPWFKGPEASPGGDLYPALAKACYAVHPMVRRDSQTRWVMDLGWYKRIRATMPGQPDGEEDPEKWKPDPEDQLMGIRIDVTADGGAPHLENRRYPQDYP